MGERGKINWPEHTAVGLQNKGTEKLQRRTAPSPLEVGGRGRVKGKLSPREVTPSHTANRPLFLSKDFLRPDRRCTLGLRREKAHRARGEGFKPLADQAAQHRGKRRGTPVERAPSLWLPGQLATEGKGAPRQGRGRQASGHPGRSPRRAKARSTWGDATKTSGCLARTRRVLPTHSDICLQRPALPTAGLN